MDQLLDLVKGVQPVALLDIGLTALLIYGLFSLIRGTRAVRLVIGVTVLYVIYVVAQALGLQLLSQILQAGAVVGLLALVVVFQPELRRGLERIGRVGSLGWLLAPGARRAVEKVAALTARAATNMGAQKIGALIVIERETGLQDAAETGVMLDAELSLELIETIFTPHSALHDGAAIVRHERVVSAGVVLPLSESGVYRERFGTRHRAALGITEQTDAIAVVVSEETGSVSLVERGRIVRDLDEPRLARGLAELLEHNALSAARLPARATALRRTLPLRRPSRARRQSEASPPAAAPAPSPAASSSRPE
ncbi:MAG TPA: diadenylate cyclase CdaA [Candidatus Limnocylindrales bacterium]|nr:diadenylate cyclase CdaA [Candidatus Limnocylindrales bacterium]